MPTPANLNQPYDPSSVQPYQAPEIPEPDMTAATTSTPGSDPSSPGKSSKGYDFTRPGAGNITHGGAIAGMADNLLRGFMDGRAKGEAMKAMKMKRETDNIRANVDLASKNFYNVAASGADQNSKEFKDAKAASDGAWNSWTTYLQGHITPPDAGKKGKGAKVKEGLAGMFGKGDDPAQVSQGYYQVAVKMGNPVNHQVAALYGPQAKQARQTAADTATAKGVNAQTSVATAQHDAQTAQYQSRMDVLTAKQNDPKVGLTKAEQQEQYRLTDVLTPPKDQKEQVSRYITRWNAQSPEDKAKPEQQAVQKGYERELEKIEGKDFSAQVPKTPFEAEVAAEQKEKGRSLTTDEIDRIDSRIEMRKKIRASGAGGARDGRDVNTLQEKTDAVMDKIDTGTDKKMEDLNKEADAGKSDFTRYDAQWTARAAEIERQSYQAKVTHAKSYAAEMRRLGHPVDVPMPEPWKRSFLQKVDPDSYNRLFPDADGSKQESAPSAPKETKPPKTSTPAGATGKAKGSDGKWHYHDAKGSDLGVVI